MGVNGACQSWYEEQLLRDLSGITSLQSLLESSCEHCAVLSGSAVEWISANRCTPAPWLLSVLCLSPSACPSASFVYVCCFCVST